MRACMVLIVAAGCAAEPKAEREPETLGTGTLTSVTWDGGSCPGDYHCSGTFALDGATFDARFPDRTPVAAGALASATVDRITALVAAIPAGRPAGTLSTGGDGPGIVELWISLPDETRVYISNGFEGELGLYLYELRDAIERCASGTLVAAYTSCTP